MRGSLTEQSLVVGRKVAHVPATAVGGDVLNARRLGVGSPQTEIPLALLTLNVGVEACQMFFIIVVLGLLAVASCVI